MPGFIFYSAICFIADQEVSSPPMRSSHDQFVITVLFSKGPLNFSVSMGKCLQ